MPPTWIALVHGLVGVMMSPPCPPWSRSSAKCGLTHEAGRVFVHTISELRIYRPSIVACENVDTIQTHEHFQGLIDMMHWASYKPAWQSVSDLIAVSPISRSRWLAIFIPNDQEWTLSRTGTFTVLPQLNLTTFRALINLPDEHEWLLTLDNELKAIYGDWKMFHKGFNRMPRSRYWVTFGAMNIHEIQPFSSSHLG